MSEEAISAKVAERDGRIIGADASGIHWEAEMAPEQLTAFIARCADGAELEVISPEGQFRALARRWWVWPEGVNVRVRLLLERYGPS